MGDAFGDAAHQGWLNADALYHHKVVYVKKVTTEWRISL